MTDFYAETGEYIDILSRTAWEHLGAVVATALDGVDTSRGPVLDIGAGTGLGTAALLRALPGAEIVAVEPSATLRAVLLAKLADADFRRVTVYPEGLPAARLPTQISAGIAMNMLGHLDPVSRHDLWSMVAQRLSPGGRFVVNLLPPFEAIDVAGAGFAEAVIGRRRYVGGGRATRSSPETIDWHMTYHTYEDDVLVGELSATSPWWVLGSEQLHTEVTDHGLSLTTHGSPSIGMHVIRGRT